MNLIKTVNHGNKVVSWYFFENLRVVLELNKIVKVSATLRLATEMAQNGN